MKTSILSLSLVLGLAGGALAQSNCAISVVKSGTGLTRTYTASNAGSGTFSYTLYSFSTIGGPGGGLIGSSTTNTLTVTYPGGGIYNIFAEGISANCGDSVVFNDTVAGPPPPTTNKISQYITLDTTVYGSPSYVPQVKTWLIKKDTTAGTLTAVDSVVTGMALGCHCYTTAVFNAVPNGTYRTKSYIINQPSGATTGYLPTYSNTTAYWNSADTFVLTGSTTLIKGTALLTGTLGTGTGFVGGLISAGANKGTAEGDPVVGITVFLRNGTGKVVQMANTGNDGKYAFSNLSAGTYTVYPEELSYRTTASDLIAITASQNSAGVNFKRNAGAKEYVPGSVLGVGTLGTTAFSVAPNPATDKLQIELGTTAGPVNATLSNITGQVVLREIITGAKAAFSVSSLPAGLYVLQLQSGAEVVTQKVQIQH